MDWFNRKKKRRLEVMQQGIMATSKTSLKMQCLFCAKGDLKEAKELYEFFAADMPNLPETDPIPPTMIDKTKDTVNGMLGWIKENQDTIGQVYDFIISFIKKKAPVQPPAEPLPSIN